MEKFKVSFVANNQQLTATGTKHASDTYADIEAAFALGERWTDMDSVSAVWWNDFTRIATVLDSEGKCTVPHEVLTRKGCVRVNLVGSVVEDGELVTRLTSYSAEAVHVNEKIKLTGNEPQTITPSQYEQFVANVKADADRAESAKESAETASASAQGYAQSASASATSASESATASEQSATASARDAQTVSEIAVEVEVMKNEAELARDEILGMRAEAVTLPAGSEATASYADGLLSLGIPRGDTGATGAKGDKGDTGATPNLTIGNVETLEPTESATATITGTAENPVLNLGIPQGDTGEVSLADLSTLLPTDTASGDIASFPDGQSVIPLLSLIADIEPIQDLHGYDKPWSGGSGVNKLIQGETRAFTSNGVTWTANADGSITARGTATGASTFTYILTYIPTEAGYNFNGNYKFVCFPSIPTAQMASGIYIGKWISVYPNTTTSLNDVNAQISQLWFQIQDGQTVDVTFYPMIYSASETAPTSWTPYSNICPISGWTEVNTQRTGINVWDEEWELGVYGSSSGNPIASNSNIRSKSTNYIRVFPSTAYYFKTASYLMEVYQYRADKTYIGKFNATNNVYTTHAECHYIRFNIGQSYGTTYNNDISINYPSTDTEYHPYLGDTYTTALGQTVYGGTLDVVSGELTVDRAMVDLGTLTWNKYGSSTIYYTSVAGKAVGNTNIISDTFFLDAVAIANMANGSMRGYNTNSNVYFRQDECADLSAWTTWVTNHHPQLCYELANPQTIQLTPQEVYALLGQNNVWADSGSVEVVYKADVTKWVEKKLS